MYWNTRALLTAVAVTATTGGLAAGPAGAVPATPATCDGHRVTAVGTDGDDTIDGTPRRDVIHALGGRDEVRGLGGRDIICGGKGGDDLIGGPGADRLFGGPGGYVGDDEGTGTWFGNKVDGGRGDDYLSGGPDHDIDWPDYGSTPDRVTFADATGPITVEPGGTVSGTGMGTDTLAPDFELIVGTDHADTMSTVGDRSDLRGLGGPDRLRVRPGLVDIELDGGVGDDRLDGTAGRRWMILDGGRGDDSLRASPGADDAYPGAGDDTVETYAGNDAVRGQVAPDVIGADTIATGAGDDSIGLGERSDGSTADGGRGSDRLSFSWDHGAADVDAGEGTATVDDVVATFEDTERYDFGGGDADGSLRFRGTAADERVTSVELFEVGSIEYRAGGGDDTVSVGYAWSPQVTVHGGTGDDSIRGSRRDDEIYGDAGDDTADGRSGDDRCEVERATNCEGP